MPREPLIDEAMLEIFRAEAETHAETLTSGLLALECDPADTSRLDEMMRAAHSMKGASLIVGIEPAVGLAHVLEDCFVAAQEGRLVLRPEQVDRMLRGVDMLIRMAAMTRDAAQGWDEIETESAPVVAAIRGILSEPAGKHAGSNRGAEGGMSPASGGGAGGSSPGACQETVLHGPAMLDAEAAETMRREFLGAADSGCVHLRIDLTATSDVDATGLVLLGSLSAYAARHFPQMRVELVGVQPDLRQVLAATGVDQQYPASPSARP